MSQWNNHVLQNEQRFVDELCDFIRIPSVSAMPEHGRDMQRAADWIARRLTAAGIENAAVMPTGGHPAVYGEWLHAGPEKPTILLYGHYDVQPPDPLSLWETPAFEPSLRDDRIYARGASDDKGGMLTPILAAEILLRAEGRLPVNVKFCFEGEEEISSPSMDRFLGDNREQFAADLALSADGLLWSADQPMLLLGLRGMCALEISVYGPTGDLHSGLHGGVLRNPIDALALVISSMRDSDGRIAVKGFYDEVIELSEDQRAAIARIPMDEEAYRRELGIPVFFGEPGYTTRERNWIRPTLEFNGIWGGYSGPGKKTVIPSAAHAKITCRLVADQDPERILSLIEDHVRMHAPAGIRAETTRLPGNMRAYLLDAHHQGNRVASEVLTEVFGGRKPYHAYVGGSIAICGLFRKHLGVDTISFGWSSGDENLHAPNEFFRLRNFRRGIVSYCEILHRLALQGI